MGCSTGKNPPPHDSGNLPGMSSELTAEQTGQLKQKLESLTVGMSRDKVIEILDLPSFSVHYFADANPTGITYRFGHGHVLTLGIKAGLDASTLSWAKFDGEVWPKNWERSNKAAPAQ